MLILLYHFIAISFLELYFNIEDTTHMHIWFSDIDWKDNNKAPSH